MDNNDWKLDELEVKTAYEWCLDANIRVLDLNEWPLEWHDSKERHFFEFKWLPKTEFLDALKVCRVKYNSTPRKTDNYLEYRMYGLVPYNISDIQKGIQFGHAVVEYGLSVKGLPKLDSIYTKWAKEDKTFIILNGGTTNEKVDNKWYGTLQRHRDSLNDAGIPIAEFREPDLNDTLTGVVFLVDERVFNKELYPDFVAETVDRYNRNNQKEIERVESSNARNYLKWEEKIGGPSNAFLRNFLKTFKLA